MRHPTIRNVALLYLSRDRWLSSLELSRMDTRLRTRSIHAMLDLMVKINLARRRRRAVTGFWEYALPEKPKPKPKPKRRAAQQEARR